MFRYFENRLVVIINDPNWSNGTITEWLNVKSCKASKIFFMIEAKPSRGASIKLLCLRQKRYCLITTHLEESSYVLLILRRPLMVKCHSRRDDCALFPHYGYMYVDISYDIISETNSQVAYLGKAILSSIWNSWASKLKTQPLYGHWLDNMCI